MTQFVEMAKALHRANLVLQAFSRFTWVWAAVGLVLFGVHYFWFHALTLHLYAWGIATYFFVNRSTFILVRGLIDHFAYLRTAQYLEIDEFERSLEEGEQPPTAVANAPAPEIRPMTMEELAEATLG